MYYIVYNYLYAYIVTIIVILHESFSFYFFNKDKFFSVILLSIILVIFNTSTHSLFAEEQNFKNMSNYQLSSSNFSSQQEKELFLQKYLTFSSSKEIKESSKEYYSNLYIK